MKAILALVSMLVLPLGSCGNSVGRPADASDAASGGQGGGANRNDALDASSGSDAEITRPLCAQMCEAVLQITCPNLPDMADCVDACVAQAATTTCGDPGAAYYRCLVAEGSMSLMCDPVVALVVFKDGYCTKESSDLAKCLQHDISALGGPGRTDVRNWRQLRTF